MNVEWDPEKGRANRRKHGIRFEDARAVFHDPDRIEVPDDRDYGEERWITIGLAGQHLLFVVFTERNGTLRIISARKADNDDAQDYFANRL
jgi:uncharacterized DUF497 family protein